MYWKEAFFTKHRQTYPKYEQRRQKLGTFLENKVGTFKNFINISWSLNQIFLTEIFFWKDSTNFLHRKMTLEVRILRCLRRLFIILVSLTMTLFSEKMLISHICIRGLMPNLIKKSWTVSSGKLYYVRPNVVLAISQTKTWGIYIPYTPPRTARISD